MKDYELVLEHRLTVSLSQKSFSMGLMELAKHPQHYIEALTDCEILEEKTEGGKKVFSRKLQFPSFSFEDVVSVTDTAEFIEEVPAIGEMSSSSFSIRYEVRSEKEGEAIFTYHEKEKTALPDNIKKLREAAWIAKDKQFIEKLEAQFGLGSN